MPGVKSRLEAPLKSLQSRASATRNCHNSSRLPELQFANVRPV